MRRISFLIAVVLCLGAGTSRALTVDEIVAKNVEARGGAAKLKAITSLKVTGKVRFGSFLPVEAELAVLQKNGKIRQETTLQGLTQIEAFDGAEGWSLDPFEGRREAQKTSADEAKELQEDADIQGPLVDWKAKGHQVESLGTEDVDGTPALKLRLTLKNGDVWIVYLDPDTFLEIRELKQTTVRGVERLTEVDLGSYEQVAGVWFPFSIEAGRPGRPKNTRLTFERAEANVPAEDALFSFPAPGMKLARTILPSAVPPLPSAAAPRAKSTAPAAVDSGVVSGLGIRNIGSAEMSGRVASIAARNADGKTTIFVGAASGGVWKSVDGGTTFKPVFDKAGVQSIGSIAIDPSNPKNVWVGTGEPWTRNSTSFGDGIYKSTDGGETFANVGLPDSERIARVLVHPKSSDVVFACVPGKLWSDSADRGLYRTADGGKTWSLVLKGSNLSTGCSSVSIDAKNPDVMLAGLWDFRRKGWTFRSGGDGPNAPSGSGLFRSSDGGKTWAEVAAGQNGLPAKPWGRVEVVHAPSDPKTVYALVEGKSSALYHSSDGGATWDARDKSQMMVWRPFYFARLVVDPTNPQRVFKAGGEVIASEDGGKTFSGSGGRGHGDWHDVWIDPDNPKHVLGADDGGFWLSYDGGSRWWKSNNLPISQFYHVALDAKDPYQVYGGLQDNGSWAADSQYPGGITNARWEDLWFGDGFWTVPDPADPEGVYAEAQGGNAGYRDRKTHSMRFVQPFAGYHEKLRFNWNTPIATSPSDKDVIYMGAQFLFRSKDKGRTWDRISPDLTTNDPEKQKQEESGGITVDNSSAEMHTTIYSISESPKDKNVLWVGTDDGNLQLTKDGGKTWTNVVANVPGLPKSSWVSWVQASRHDGATAYATFDRHTFGDMTPWVYKTADFGKTWSRLASPDSGVKGYAHCVQEDTVSKNLLFVGTELGLWVSVDGGARWSQFKAAGFPNVAVRDIQVHPRDGDLVLATHGRGMWIVDDLTPLRALTPEVLAKDFTFLPGRQAEQRFFSFGGGVQGDATFVGDNPSPGAVITFFQKSRHLFGPISLEILDANGKLIDTITPPKRRGINRVSWAMQVKPPRVPPAAQTSTFGSQGPRVPPGTYTVRLKKGADVAETKVDVKLDRRAPYSVEDRKAQYDAVMRVHALFGRMSALVEKMEAAKAKTPALAPKIEEIRKKIVATKEGGAITGEERLREHTDNVYGALLIWEGRPAPYQIERVDVLTREVEDVEKEFGALVK